MRKKIIATFGWILIAAVFAVALVSAGIPRMLGGTSLTVLTGSMQPELNPGDVIALVPAKTDRLQVGDVVTFQPVSGDPMLITHRITAIDVTGAKPMFTTRGDANNADDPAIVGAQIQGRVLYSVPYVGWVRQLIGNATPTVVFCVAAALILGGGITLLRPAQSHRLGKDEA